MEVGRSTAQVGVEQTQKAGTALSAITSAVSTINQMNTHIATAVEEQNATTEEINRNVLSINQLSDQTAESAGQMMRSSEDLAQLAAELQGLVNQFKLASQ